MELYEAYTDYHGMMELTEELIRTAAEEGAGHDADYLPGRRTSTWTKPLRAA